MNQYLSKALAEIRSFGVKKMPSEQEIMNAEDGTTFEVELNDGKIISLTKNSETSYTVG